MALNQINRITWIVETIKKAGKISFAELNQKWLACMDLSGGVEMSKRSFHQWILDIQDRFGLIIENENKGEYRYFISNLDDLKQGTLEKWLYDIYSVSTNLIDNKQLRNRIVLENIPSGHRYLATIMDAMKENRRLRLVRHDYLDESDALLVMEPYFLKLFHQRWYVVGKDMRTEKVERFSLDRIEALTVLDETFTMPDNITAESFFEGCYGVMSGEGPEVQKVTLWSTAYQARYIRDLPIHESQTEVVKEKEYSVFEFHVRPFYDFIQEILRMGVYVQVLEPQWLREQMKDYSWHYNRMYNK